MSTADTTGVPTPGSRARNAAATRGALLDAALALFGEKGFDRTTTREIAERAGVDPALIMRYFGSKAALYVATVAAENVSAPAPSVYTGLQQMIDVLLTRSDERGPGPILQAFASSDTSPEILEAAREHVRQRMIDPLVAAMVERQVDRAEFRAELVVCALFGISFGRSLGWFDGVHSEPRDDAVALITQALGKFIGDAGSRAKEA